MEKINPATIPTLETNNVLNSTSGFCFLGIGLLDVFVLQCKNNPEMAVVCGVDVVEIGRRESSKTTTTSMQFPV
jgi:hypothetical protein